MGEFSKIIDKVTNIISERSHGDKDISLRKLTEEITDTINRSIGEVNFYPSTTKGKCYRTAFFLSLTSKQYIKKRGDNLSLPVMMTNIVKHMQGYCPGKTDYAILITDNWNEDVINAWRANIAQIKKDAMVEIYLVSGGKNSEIIM